MVNLATLLNEGRGPRAPVWYAFSYLMLWRSIILERV